VKQQRATTDDDASATECNGDDAAAMSDDVLDVTATNSDGYDVSAIAVRLQCDATGTA
jgi:hypothetical protein